MKGVEGHFLLGGPLGALRLKAGAGVLELRDNADAAYDDFYAANAQANDPVVGVNDTGAVIANGKVRHGTGVQSYGIGTGAVIGNARGVGAGDLQTTRLLVTQVASGPKATLLNGQNNKASAGGLDATTAGGTGCSATDQGCVALGSAASSTNRGSTALGQTVSAAGDNSLAAGSETTIPSGTTSPNSAALGRRSTTRHSGEISFAGGRIAATGDSQSSLVTWSRQTTNAVAADMFTRNATVDSFIVEAGAAYGFDLLLTGERTGGGAAVVFRFQGAVRRIGAVAMFVGGVAPVATVVAIDAALVGVVAIVLIVGLTTLVPRVTGLAATTIQWTCSGRLTRNV
jgi:hypothetical protein